MRQCKLTHGSLFSGFDAPSVAASWLGWENAFHCEINPFCNEILKYWFPNSEHYEDITKTDFKKWRGKIDILTGGFPCQPFSLAGRRKGADDNRYLWPHMLRAIQEIRPTWVIGENVAGILTMVQPGKETEMGCKSSLFGEDNRKRILLRQEYVVETICKDLEREGYSVQPLLIPACAVGAPHRRDRVWFVAHTNSNGGQEKTERKFKQAEKNNEQSESLFHSGTSSYRSDSRTEDVRQERENTILSDGPAPIAGSKRCCGRCDNWKERPIYYDWKRYSEKNQSEWNKWQHRTGKNGANTSDSQSARSEGKCEHRQREIQFNGRNSEEVQSRWQVFPTQPPVCRGNDGFPVNVDDLTIPFTRWRQESIKGYGNAIVPQVILEIFKAIEKVEQLK